MTTISNQLLKELRTDINNALDQVSQKYGLIIKAGNCSYDSDSATFKLKCSTPNALTKEQKALKHMAVWIDLDLDKIFNYNGNKYKLWGYKSRATKRPYILVQLENKAKYSFAVDIIEKNFKKTK